MDKILTASDPAKAVCPATLGSPSSCPKPPEHAPGGATVRQNDRLETRPGIKQRLISLLVPSNKARQVPAEPVSLTEVGEDSQQRSTPRPQMGSGQQPADPRLRPSSAVDDRWTRIPGVVPSASTTLYADNQVELKAGMDGGLAPTPSQLPIPQLNAIGAGLVAHVHRNVDLNVSLRVPTDQTQSKEGQGGYVGVGVHW